jgi:hypothetical protein
MVRKGAGGHDPSDVTQQCWGNRVETNRRSRIVPETKVYIMKRPERDVASPGIRVERRLPSYWRVTFDLSPVNIFWPEGDD